jgi:hypothetical protein
MQDPRNPDTVIGELNEINQLLQNHETMLSKYPKDTLMAVSKQQFESRKKQLLKELHLSLSLYFTQIAH